MKGKLAAASLALLGAIVICVPSAVATTTTAPPTPVWGFADTHVHQFSNLAFGGLVVWGESFTQNDSIETALPWDDWTPGHAGDVVDRDGNPYGLQGCPALIPPFPSKCVRHSEVLHADCAEGTGVDVLHACDGFFVHGPGGLGDLVNNFATGSLGHNVGGYPEFDGWPRYDNVTSQQVYYDWLRRAYSGGLRLMVMLAVNNESLCMAGAHIAAYGCGDMPAVDRQIQAAKDLQAFVDAKSGGAGQGWYRVVTTPQQARSAIANNQLAVVLGIEVDSLFGCKKHTTCTTALIDERIQHYHDLGVRHVFPVHLTDNGFGGTALYDDTFAFNTKVVSGDWWDYAAACPTGVDFHLGLIDTLNDVGGIPIIGDWFNGLLGSFTGLTGGAIPPRAPAGPNCNSRALTSAGQTLVNGLIDHHMILDVDHMDAPTFNATMNIAETRHYPGIASGHTGIVPTGNSGAGRHEGNKTLAQLERIRNVGGLVSIHLHQGDRTNVKEYRRGANAVVPFDCGNSDQAWAQVYLYAVDHMGGGAVGFGSDFNGLSGEPAPRFNGHGHNDACGGDADGGYSPAGGVSYPITPFGLPGSIGKMQIGTRTFDFNDDGLANIGLYPDFIADLRSQGLSNADLAPLFGSAEAYIRMWEKAEDETAPEVQCDPADADWHGSNVTLGCTASDYPSGLEHAADASFTLATTVAAGTETASAATGTREVCDTRANCVTVGPFTLRIDRKAPVVSCVPPDFAWHATDVSVPCSATEGGSGLVNADDALFSLTTAVAAGTETASASTGSRAICDSVGNCDTAGPYLAKVDKKAPSITIAAPAPTSYEHTATLTLAYTVLDGGSGVATVVPTLDGASSVGGHGLASGQAIDLLTEVPAGPHAFLVQAADAVGNMSSSPVAFSVIVTAAGLKDEVTRFRGGGAITKDGIAGSLLAKLTAAAALRAAGDCAGAANQYRAFVNEVEAQTGKAIDPVTAGILIADAQYLIGHCP